MKKINQKQIEYAIKNNAISSMNKEQLEYIIYEEQLTLEQLKQTKKAMEKFNFSNFDKETVNDLINDFNSKDSDNIIRHFNAQFEKKIQGYSINELNKIRKETIPNDGTGLYETITKVINEKETSKFKNVALSFFLFFFLFGKRKKGSLDNNKFSKIETDAMKTGNYDKTSFEEQEYESDDYYSEDVD